MTNANFNRLGRFLKAWNVATVVICTLQIVFAFVPG